MIIAIEILSSKGFYLKDYRMAKAIYTKYKKKIKNSFYLKLCVLNSVEQRDNGNLLAILTE